MNEEGRTFSVQATPEWAAEDIAKSIRSATRTEDLRRYERILSGYFARLANAESRCAAGDTYKRKYENSQGVIYKIRLSARASLGKTSRAKSNDGATIAEVATLGKLMLQASSDRQQLAEECERLSKVAHHYAAQTKHSDVDECNIDTVAIPAMRRAGKML